MSKAFEKDIKYLKGVGEKLALLLDQELHIKTYGDLIQHYPFRHEDRTQYHALGSTHPQMPYIQAIGKITHLETVGKPPKKRLVAHFRDDTGEIELVWFQGIQQVASMIQPGVSYVAFGKPSAFGRKLNIVHPELEQYDPSKPVQYPLLPVYSTTEKLKKKRIDSRNLARLTRRLLNNIGDDIPETLPEAMIREQKMISKCAALHNIHFPDNHVMLEKAKERLKFEELFFVQLQILSQRLGEQSKLPGQVFKNTSLLHTFYKEYLPFDLTGAQKKVIREIFEDMQSGVQMNRLLQGDVGSGKTIVAFICMLICISNHAQVALMAPTEILAEQHFSGLKVFANQLNLRIALLTGSTRKSERKVIDDLLRSGELNIIIGTHALLEDKVQFKNLGLAVVDEQHRFGVAQRAKLWKKNKQFTPHMLVMTATPIPRTLAMTLYGDLDLSIIDELPAGRKPIKTVRRTDSNRLRIFGFLREQINAGRQVYVVYPLIEESEKLDLKHLEDGYESVQRAFPDVSVSIVNGRMNPEDKEYEMQRFVEGKTKIMVATTVIEVGVNVPNASVMVIENAERFGLAQLHQLRGRVGRGAEQSYCILISGNKLGKDARTRLDTLVSTNNGFEIADIDLTIRGPGDLAGTQQSGILDLLVADLSQDGAILEEARRKAKQVLQIDAKLQLPEHLPIYNHIKSLRNNVVNWSRIS